jgi:Family of unknown function (DUF5994)
MSAGWSAAIRADDTGRHRPKGLPVYRTNATEVLPPDVPTGRQRRRSDPVRVSVARELGHDIDGAWWPRADRITNELPGLVMALTPLLGDITSINVNWPPLQRPPDFNWSGWEHKRQHVMTLAGEDACVNLLIIPYATYSALAVMVLRRAADLPVDPADRAKRAFLTAGSILLAAQRQCCQLAAKTVGSN